MSSLAQSLKSFVCHNLSDGRLPDMLYHCTGIDVLAKLLQDNQDLRARHCSSYDGQTETMPACKSFINYLLRQNVFSRNDAQRVDDFINKKIFNKRLHFVDTNGMLPWITCLSSDGDSSYNWQWHTQEGNGCAIHFARETLDFFVKSFLCLAHINSSGQDMVLLLPCYYIGTICNLDGLFDVFLNAHKEDFNKLNLNDDHFRGCVTNIVLASVMVKAKEFAPEQEWRLVKWLSDAQLTNRKNRNESSSEFENIGLADMSRPFRDCIQGVTVSPSSMDRFDDVKELFRSASIPFEQHGERSIVRTSGGWFSSLKRSCSPTPFAANGI